MSIAAKLDGTAYTTVQTDAWCSLEISGADARHALERICPVDLYPDAFVVGAVARTVMEHMGAIIACTGDDAFLLLSASSSAKSFLHAVELSANQGDSEKACFLPSRDQVDGLASTILHDFDGRCRR